LQKINTNWFIYSILAFQLVDLASTQIGLKAGGTEANSIYVLGAQYLGMTQVLLLGKLTSIYLLTTALFYIKKLNKNFENIIFFNYGIVAIYYLLVCTNNIILIK